jgi:uncharacterized protein YukE
MKFNSSGFEPLQGEFSTCITSYQTARQKIVDAKTNVMREWKGEARDAFEDVYEQMFVALAECGEALAGLNNELQLSLAAYIQCDEHMARSIDRNGRVTNK